MKLTDEAREAFRKAGKVGGQTAAKNMTKAERVSRAAKAAKAKWKKASK